MSIAEVEKWFSEGHHKTLCPEICPEMSLFEQACSDAKFYHEGDKYGPHDYYEYHLLGVVGLIQVHELTSRLLSKYKVIGILHDVHEDHDVPLDTLREIYGSDIADAIEAISYRKGLETREEYYKRCKANPLARVVKKYDAMFNMGQSALEGNDKRREYYKKIVDVMS